MLKEVCQCKEHVIFSFELKNSILWDLSELFLFKWINILIEILQALLQAGVCEYKLKLIHRSRVQNVSGLLKQQTLNTTFNHSSCVYMLIPVLSAASPFLFQDLPPGVQCEGGASCCGHNPWKNPRQCLALSGEGQWVSPPLLTSPGLALPGASCSVCRQSCVSPSSLLISRLMLISSWPGAVWNTLGF